MNIIPIIKSFIRKVLPKKILLARARAAEIRHHEKYNSMAVDNIFTEIYESGEWGGDSVNKYYSGSGSHTLAILTPYINALKFFLSTLPEKPILIDVGSGDFNVGMNFPSMVKYYHACDIVFDLQEHNRRIFDFPNVEFHCLNAIDDNLPDGDVIVIRQVLQHLSNEQIKKVIDKCYKFNKWVITEHLPSNPDFIPNLDITTGSGIRVLFNSGVVLSEPPFDVVGYTTRILCEVPEQDGIIRTTLFERNSSR